MKLQNPKILVTVGPASLNKKFLKFCINNVSLLRLNMSHIKISNLSPIISFIRKHNKKTPICIDTEGAQLRTKIKKKIFLKKNKTFY
jgi:pyruvate kinase